MSNKLILDLRLVYTKNDSETNQTEHVYDVFSTNKTIIDFQATIKTKDTTPPRKARLTIEY